MDRANEVILTSGIKACVDCAHFMPERSECGNAPRVDAVTGAPGFRDAFNERVWNCGNNRPIHFIPTEQSQAARAVRRVHLLDAIEKAIVQAQPDADEASELLDSLNVALTARYGAAYEDGVEHDLKDLQKALGKVQPFAGVAA